MSDIQYVNIYGADVQGAADPEFLHVEPMGMPGRHLAGRAAPHVHKNLFQFLFAVDGESHIDVETTSKTLAGPCAVYIPSGAVHSMTIPLQGSGWVVTGSNRSFGHGADESGHDFFAAIWHSPAFIEYDERAQDAQIMVWLLQQLYTEFIGSRPGRQLAMQDLMRLIFVNFRRHLPVGEEFSQQKHDERKSFLDFRQLLESHYREHWSVQQYASRLGMRVPTLNKICRQFTDKTAHELMHSRLLLEAQRLLIYTVATAAEISFDVGFQDPAYFNRFFRRITGVTPLQFRRQRELPG